MLRISSLRLANSIRNSVSHNTKINHRQFFWGKSGPEERIATDKQQQYGRRKEELDAEAAGSVGFDRDPIIPAVDAGTKENPILVNFLILCIYLFSIIS